ncbi:NBR1-Ig-like domain-containing protein [Luteipulveratus halotolerans]|uniref:NBR1-Ig-like domain-containing protein n=1 Tax=Luteipulveratus halotolerans TaxID=1631356 RepID=UPI0012F9C66E|nr:NBR1-Ig-like domain-containing protein [Luteipulveratus halotolerans]
MQHEVEQDTVRTFVEDLIDLRAAAGSPSYREMARRSGCISHTTLHDATLGVRMPTWATTEQFVLACGAQPQDWEDRWARAREVSPVSGPIPVAAAPVPVEEAPAPQMVLEEPADPEPVLRWWVRSRGPVLAAVVGAAATLAVLVVVGGVLPEATASAAAAPAVAAPAAQHGVSACRPSTSTPVAAPVWTLQQDVTLPDCASVATHEQVTKVWRLRNVSSRPWHSYYLERMDAPQRSDTCQTDERIVLPTVAAGARIDVRVGVTAPDVAGVCVVRWALKDSSGRLAAPGQAPLDLRVVVDGRFEADGP